LPARPRHNQVLIIDCVKVKNLGVIRLNLKLMAQRQLLKPVAVILPMISEEGIMRIFDLGLKLDRTGKYSFVIDRVKKMYREKHPATLLIDRVFHELSPNCRQSLLVDLFGNTLLSRSVKLDYYNKTGIMPPYFFVISPTMRCNLNCIGCYAAKYPKTDLPIKVVDRVFKEAREMGICFLTVTGGEPLLRNDLLELYKKYNDMYFQVYTNGTFINKEMATKISALGNVAPAIALEGFERETDFRRGKGTFNKVVDAMRNLKEEGAFFGFSAVPTRKNWEVLSSEEFVDFVIEQGCYFGWFFQYIPIGKKPDISLMMTPEQRCKFRERIGEIRKRKPIFLADFWNDGLYTNGCIAGGKKYFHINVNGDVEPCVFFHFAVDNIKEKSLKEVLSSDFFKTIQNMQPEIHNSLKPCMVIDNPQMLRKVCAKCKPRPTHPGAADLLRQSAVRKHLDLYAKRMDELTDGKWKEYSKLDWVKRVVDTDSDLTC
jgi:radical SAM protein with 4Fe4S-binding SPASM domain